MSNIKKIAVTAAIVAALGVRKGMARENDAHDEAKAESSCSMGVGCGMAGVCYAEAHGEPDMCGRKESRP